MKLRDFFFKSGPLFMAVSVSLAVGTSACFPEPPVVDGDGGEAKAKAARIALAKSMEGKFQTACVPVASTDPFKGDGFDTIPGKKFQLTLSLNAQFTRDLVDFVVHPKNPEKLAAREARRFYFSDEVHCRDHDPLFSINATGKLMDADLNFKVETRFEAGVTSYTVYFAGTDIYPSKAAGNERFARDRFKDLAWTGAAPQLEFQHTLATRSRIRDVRPLKKVAFEEMLKNYMKGSYLKASETLIPLPFKGAAPHADIVHYLEETLQLGSDPTLDICDLCQIEGDKDHREARTQLNIKL